MPIYEYECEKCHSRFEMKRSFGEDGSAECPECRGKACRIFTSVPVIFKGSGFYVTDHQKTNSASRLKRMRKIIAPPLRKRKSKILNLWSAQRKTDK